MEKAAFCVHCTGRAAFLFAVSAIELNGALFWGGKAAFPETFMKKHRT